MTGLEKEEKCFTFTWKLENASYCLQKKGEDIESPAFVVDEIHKTKWKLTLYPRGEEDGNYISCYLSRDSDCTGEKIVEIKYKLSFIGKCGLDLTPYGSIRASFLKGGGYGYPKFEKREDVFILKRSTFLPKDTLTVRCKIWKNLGDMAENVRCFALTRIGVEKRSFVWNLEEFSTFQPEKECTYLIKSTEKDTDLMSVNLSLVGGQNCEEMIHFKLTRRDQNVKYCALRLSVVDIHGRRVGFNQDEFRFDILCNIQSFTFLFSRRMLMMKKSLYLPGDILSLQWECTFSKGIVSEEIEEVQCGRIVPVSKFLMLTNEQK
ncbi:hypothetical protein AVEN_18701-1 [Araneus ventricosus]|uniref:MATH domain-containing protein n=1 Tax=Araneus ventricosus TaxID=182803 RepID=A0A4Y2PIX5_ARAVE|nr:hypothetical protein AVEN_18701-1 [Araneus ventricosus]